MDKDQLNIADALEALDSGDYQKVLAILRPLAENGNPKAQAHLGVLYQLGSGVTRDLPKALYWLTKAAECGEGIAAHNLGTLYMTGYPDIPLNPEESKKWFRRAQELGFVVAQEGTSK